MVVLGQKAERSTQAFQEVIAVQTHMLGQYRVAQDLLLLLVATEQDSQRQSERLRRARDRYRQVARDNKR